MGYLVSKLENIPARFDWYFFLVGDYRTHSQINNFFRDDFAILADRLGEKSALVAQNAALECDLQESLLKIENHGLGKMLNALEKKYPGLLIAGTLNGYYTNEGQVVAAINDARPDVLFVCLGAPKQEQFMALRGEALNVTLMAGLGGTLDGLAGEVKRAPDFFIRLNLEWLYRLLCQPKRIGRVIKLPLYLLSAFAARGKSKNA